MVIAIIGILISILVPKTIGFVDNATDVSKMVTAKTIWTNAEYAITRVQTGQANDFMSEFESLLTNDAILDPRYLTVTVDNVTYTIRASPNGHFVVTAPGNISYPN